MELVSCPLYNPLWKRNGNILKRIKGQAVCYQLLILLPCTQTRGRTGMEVNPLVFETSASTDSAIWACLISQMRCKDTAFF